MFEKAPKKSERTREHLIAVSTKQFAEKGFDACTMRDLARAAGVSAASFYYYFPSKEEIVGAFYQRSLARHLEDARCLIERDRPLAENLRRVVLARFEEFSETKPLLRVLRGYAFTDGSPLSPFHRKHRSIRNASVALFTEMIARSRERLPAALQPELAELLWLYHLGLLAYWTGDDSPDARRTHALLESSLGHLSRLFRFLQVPGTARLVRPVLATLRQAGILEGV